MQEKLCEFQKILNRNYPCEFHIYTLQDSLFQGLPKLNNNYLAYFRLKIASALPAHITTCLYLDVDMLCVGDIAPIFSTDLEEYIMGVVVDADYKKERIMPSLHTEKEGFALDIPSYFNSGLMFINLTQWRKDNIEKRCFKWMQDYIPTWYDQDVLNAIIPPEKRLLLPLRYNFMLGHLESHWENSFKDESENHTLSYTRKEYEEAKQNAKILHYLTPLKPWRAHTIYENGIINRPYRKEWWEMALQTPIFCEELQTLYLKTHEEAIDQIAQVLQNQNRQIQKIRNRMRPHKLIANGIKKAWKKLRKRG